MIQGFYTGINGLMTHQSAIDVVADNIANINTVGFRGSDAEFSNIFEKKLLGTSLNSSVDSQIGLGVRMSATAMSQKSGTLLLTEKNTDLAIAGNGWFGISKGVNTYYTRDGNFGFDATRDLTTPDGYYVLGTMGGNISNGVLTSVLASVALSDVSSQTKLQLPQELTSPVEPTTEAKFFGNLGVKDETRAVSAKAIDLQSNVNNIRIELKKSDPQVLPGTQWDAKASVSSLDGLSIYDTQNGVISFDENGALLLSTLNSINNNGTSVALNFGSGYDGLFTSDYDFHLASSSDGALKGDLAGYSVAQNGQILASFTNGKQSSVGAIALYHFTNERGLERISGTRFEQSANSGAAMFFKDASGNTINGATIMSNRLESSNVALDGALTELIVLQRSYDANAKSITTSDDMIQKALAMKK